jgi:hypothetical protein
MRLLLLVPVLMIGCIDLPSSRTSATSSLPDCRAGRDPYSTAFVARDTAFSSHDWKSGVVVGRDAQGRTRMIQGCSVVGVGYRPVPTGGTQECASTMRNSAELAAILDPQFVFPRLGVNATTSTAYLFQMRTGNSLRASQDYVMRNQLQGVNCAAAQGFVRAVAVGDYFVRTDDQMSGGASVSSAQAKGASQSMYFDKAQGVPLYLEIQPIAEVGQVACATGNIVNPSSGQCLPDPNLTRFAVSLHIEASHQSCTQGGMESGECDLNVGVSLDGSRIESARLNQDSNVDDYDILRDFSFADLRKNTLSIDVEDRDLVDNDPLGTCAIRIDPAQLIQALSGSPVQQRTNCPKYALTWRVAKR